MSDMLGVLVYLAGAPGLRGGSHAEDVDLIDPDSPPDQLRFDKVPAMETRQAQRAGTRQLLGHDPRWDDDRGAWVYKYRSS